MKPPDIDSAVQTTPPMSRAANMPYWPVRPAATSTRLLRIRVIMVMPETGLVPTMAMARAATVVNRKLITKTVIVAIRPSRSGCGTGLSTEKLKNTQMTRTVSPRPQDDVLHAQVGLGPGGPVRRRRPLCGTSA